MAAGPDNAPGASAAASAMAVPSVMAANLTAARPPSLAATMTVSTASAGQAVYFIAQATPRTAAGCQASPVIRMSSARARQVRAITGGSVMPIASGKAITGDERAAAARQSAMPRLDVIRLGTAQLAANLLAVTRNVANSRPNVTAASNGRGSPRMPGRPSAFGRPNTAITGRYGL